MYFFLTFGSIVVFIISYLILTSLKNKLLYKDDGNWFYYAIFQKQGIKNYTLFRGKLYHTSIGMYNIQALFAFLYKKIGKNKLTFFNKVKMSLYSLQCLSIYLIIYIYSNNFLLSFILGISFNLIYFLPFSKYYITYAENFQIMPVLFAFVFYKLAIIYHFTPLILMSGILISFAMHWKVPGVILLVFFPIIFLFNTMYDFTIYYLIGLFIINIIVPILLYDWKRFTVYFIILFGEPIYYFLLSLRPVWDNKIFLSKFMSKTTNMVNTVAGTNLSLMQKERDQINKKYPNAKNKTYGYIENRQKAGNKSKLVLELAKNYIKEFRLLFPIAIAQIIYGIWTLNPDAIAITVFLFGAILIWYIQGGVTLNHMNIITPPLFILFAMGLYNFSAMNEFGIILIIIYLGFFVNEYFRYFYKEFKTPTVDLPCYDIKYNAYFKESIIIGEYIKQNSSRNDRIYVWGNMPTVYLYAERMCLNPNDIFTYPTGVGQIHYDIYRILYELSDRPPKFFVLFQYIDISDEWDMNKIQNEINVPYKLDKVFQIKARHIQFEPIPIYKRDDKLYCELLIEKYRITNDVKYLEKVFEIEPLNIEAKFWIKVDKDNLDYEQSLQILNDFKIDSITKRLLVIDLMKRYDKIDEIEAVIVKFEIDSDNWRIFLELGEYYFNKGEMKAALSMYNSAVKINSLSAELLNNFGVLSFQLQDNAKSIQFLKKALDILPEYEDAKENLKEIEKI